MAELERIKGGGLINKQIGEQLCFVIKGGYPLWLYQRNGKVYLFDGLNNTSWTISYPMVPSSQALKEDLQAKGRVLENYLDYLSDYGNWFQNSQSNQLLLRGLINDPVLRNEFTIYHQEAMEIDNRINPGYALFAPFLKLSR
ncbi:MAG: hypothetical protein M1167_04090 [Chloroflexi bacterium]|nr:hypothetical protein [Chloroflexota bacterium]